MRFRIVSLAVVGALLSSSVTHAAAVTSTHSQHSSHRSHSSAIAGKHRRLVAKVLRVAPADEYFGRLKMSILGIRNELHDLAAKAAFSPEKSEDVLRPAGFVEDALHDWEHKYPSDPWLAKDVFQLTQLYSEVHTQNGSRCKDRTMKWSLGRYGHTRYAALARTQFAASTQVAVPLK